MKSKLKNIKIVRRTGALIAVAGFCLFGFTSLLKNDTSLPLVPVVSELLQQPKLVTTTFQATDSIVLQFKNVKGKKHRLLVRNAYGTSLLEPESFEDGIQFMVPKPLAHIAGFVTYAFITNERIIQKGYFELLPTLKTETIASYVGPPSITAGGRDYSMLVVVPTDSFDNPLVDSTKIAIKHQFKNTLVSEVQLVKNCIAWKRFYSPKMVGRLLVSSSLENSFSAESTINVTPSVAKDFKITAAAKHNFADGNQVVTIQTSEIKDRFGNFVAEGTMVNFIATDSLGMKLQSSGSTLRGSATGYFLHPEAPTKWNVTAFVHGVAQSNSVPLHFESALKKITVHFDKKSKLLKVGPLHSFMGQLVNDGIRVHAAFFNAGKLVHEIRKETRLGNVIFDLNGSNFPAGDYRIILKVLGIEKTINATVL